MTKADARRLYATHAMQGLLADPERRSDEILARRAFAIAAAMLAEEAGWQKTEQLSDAEIEAALDQGAEERRKAEICEWCGALVDNGQTHGENWCFFRDDD